MMKALKVSTVIAAPMLAVGVPPQSAQAFCCGFFGGGFSFSFGVGGGWGWGGPFWGYPYWGGPYGGYPLWAGYWGYPYYGYPTVAYLPYAVRPIMVSTPEVPAKT